MRLFSHCTWPQRVGSRLAALLAIAASLGVASAQAADVADITYTLGKSAGSVTPLLGVNAGPLHWFSGTPDVVGGYKQIGVKLVRTHDFPGPVDMSLMYPDRSKDPTLQSSYNFSKPVPSTATAAFLADYSSDQAIAALKNNGFGVYLRIWDSAGNVVAPTASERANWVQAAVNVVKHYQDGQWSGYTGLITQIEIGNEPNSTGFWPAPYTKEEFYKLYVDTAKAIRAVYPTMKIGGPGITQQGFRNPVGQTWFKNFLDYVKSNNAPLDFFSWHIYSTLPDDFVTAAKYYRGELDSRGFTATESHLTEYNTAVGAIDTTSASDGEDFRTGGKGAALMTATWINLQQNGVKQAFFYRANDPNATDRSHDGLFDTNALPRKSALAFSLWSEFAGYSDRIDPVASVSNAGLKALAASRADGQMAVLIANTGTISSNWSLNFSDSRKLSDYAVSLRTVDDSSGLVTGSIPGGSVFTIAPNSVQLLTMHSKTQVFSASASSFGILSKQLLALRLQPLAGDIGKTQNVYLAALLGNSVYINGGGIWRLYTGGDIAAYSSGVLPPELNIPVLTTATDLRTLGGTQILLGYGSSVTEMVSAGRYKAVLTVGQMPP